MNLLKERPKFAQTIIIFNCQWCQIKLNEYVAKEQMRFTIWTFY